MDRFVARTRTRAHSTPKQSKANNSVDTEPSPVKPSHGRQLRQPGRSGKERDQSQDQSEEDIFQVNTQDTIRAEKQRESEYAKMAEAVAALLKPTLQESIAVAVQQGIEQLRKDMATQNKMLREVEERISLIEDDAVQTLGRVCSLETAMQPLLDKIDDLENRARRNNLRIIGLPESYKPSALLQICSAIIPKALGISTECKVERVHRIGPLYTDKASPRPIIAKYLNYNDKALLLQNFRKNRNLEVEGHNLLLFADYSMELSKKRKSFQKACTILHEKQIRFTLAYPAVLKIQSSDGSQCSFREPREAENFANKLGSKGSSISPLRKTQSIQSRDQRAHGLSTEPVFQNENQC